MLFQYCLFASFIIGTFGRIGRAASTQLKISARSRSRSSSSSSSSSSTGYSGSSGSWTGPSYGSMSTEPAWDEDGHNTITMIKIGRLNYESYNISSLYKENPAGIEQYHGWTIPKSESNNSNLDKQYGYKIPGTFSSNCSFN